MPAEAAPRYAARLGYVDVDARRYERRRYGGLRRWANQRMLVRALGRALVDVSPGALVLDLPCGTGVLASFLRSRRYRVVGADISPAMLGVAHGRGDVLGHVRADVEAPPWRPGTFDAVVSARFVMLLPPALRPKVLAGLARLTRGPLVATFCHPYTTKSFTRLLRRAIGMRAKPIDARRVTRAQLEREAAAAGLRVERVLWVVPLFSEVWVVVLRRAEPAT